MREVLGGQLQSRLAALKGGGDGQLGGSCSSLSTVVSTKPQTRSCSLENILDDSAPLTRQQLFLSNDSLASGAYSNRSKDDSPATTTPHSGSDFKSVPRETPIARQNAPAGVIRNRLTVVPMAGLSGSQRSRPRSVGSCLDIVIETTEEDVKETVWQGLATSCLNVNAPADQYCSSASYPPPLPSCHPSSFSYRSVSSFSSSAVAKAQGSNAATGPSGPRPACSTSNLRTLRTPAVVRRCLSSLDVSKPSRPVSLFIPPVCVPTSSSQPPQSKPEHSKTSSPLPFCLLVCECLMKLIPSNI